MHVYRLLVGVENVLPFKSSSTCFEPICFVVDLLFFIPMRVLITSTIIITILLIIVIIIVGVLGGLAIHSLGTQEVSTRSGRARANQ